jgi:DNA-binding FrmR family transcriptional regulator
MPAAKDGLEKLAAGIGAVRRALQGLIAPELKEHTSILRGHTEALNAIVGVLKEQSEILRQHGERLARVEGRLEGIDDRLRPWIPAFRAWTAGLGKSSSDWSKR